MTTLLSALTTRSLMRGKATLSTLSRCRRSDRAAVLKYKMELATNINLDVNMAAACKADAKRFCEYVKDFKFPGKVIACLREKKPSLKGSAEP